MNIASIISRSKDAADAALRRGAQYITVRNTLSMLWELTKLLTSGTFLCCMMGPFAAWAGLLLWIQARYPTEIVDAVAAGPALVVFLWILGTMAWMVVFAGTRVRQILSLSLACALLAGLATHLPPICAPRATSAAGARCRRSGPSRRSRGGS